MYLSPPLSLRGPNRTSISAPAFGFGLHVLEARRRLLNVGREVLHLLHLADLDRLVVTPGAALRPLERLFLGLYLDHPIAAEHFLGLDERAVGHFRLAARERDARAHRWRM